MYGIATAGDSSTSDYNNRILLLEVTGTLNAKARNTHYTMKVPYARLSQTVQRICRSGARIASVTMAAFEPSATVGEVTTNKVVEVPDTAPAETVVIETAPQPAPDESKQTTPKAKGMGTEKQTRNTKRDRKPKSRQ